MPKKKTDDAVIEEIAVEETVEETSEVAGESRLNSDLAEIQARLNGTWKK